MASNSSLYSLTYRRIYNASIKRFYNSICVIDDISSLTKHRGRRQSSSF